jgi:DNA-binding LacI/PurR family transcriptional regulator
MTTILDVCRLANVSKATVSRVLSGNRKVKEDTRDIVMQAVEQLNYRPNQLAQTLATKVSNTIGVLTNGLTDNQLGQMLRQLDAALWEQGRSFVLANDIADAATLADKLNYLASRHCDAILVLGKNYDASWFNMLDLDAFPPLLTMNQTLIDVAGVQFDKALTTELACNYLYSHGHTQIAILLETGSGGEQMLDGYRRALENRSLPFNKQLIVQNMDSATATSLLINRYLPFTAVLVPDDHQAIEVIRTLSQYNIQVPHEVSVLSLITGIEGERFTPAITGFDIPEEKMLQSLLRILDEVVKGHDGTNADIPREFLGKLVIRQSVKTLD